MCKHYAYEFSVIHTVCLHFANQEAFAYQAIMSLK